jgi:HAD superfamily phosphatase (TIGR01668 family)
MGNLLTPDAYIKTIFGIKPERLKANGIKGLILDIDNTLVPTHAPDANDRVIQYIKGLQSHGLKAIIVSNAKQRRVERFAKPLGIDYIYKALKPFGKGYREAIRRMNLKAEEVAIIGDQLFTDIVGGKLAGVKTILISPIDPDEPFLLKLKRLVEKPFLKGKTFLDDY